MKTFRVYDLLKDDVFNNEYDIAFFACGYEARCTNVAKKVKTKNIIDPVVLGFKELKINKQRSDNDEFYLSKFNVDQILMSADNESEIYNILNSKYSHQLDTLRVLIDYSSMSRPWYSGVLNWARFSDNISEIVIDFVYSVGGYHGDIVPMVINEIIAIPGCEGGPVPLNKGVAVFGLGLDSSVPLCVLDKLEPDTIFCYYASPSSSDEYPLRTYNSNKEIIEKHAASTLELPLNSVETTYSHLSELIAPYLNESDITIIPMGPKPHVLAAILLAIKFEEITCLRVSGRLDKTKSVRAKGGIVITRVVFTRGKIGGDC